MSNNLTLTTTLSSLNSTTLSTITSLKASFLQNIAGLTLSYSSITKQPVQTGFPGRGRYGRSGYLSYGGRNGGYGSFNINKNYGVTSNIEEFDGNEILNYVNLNNSPLGQALPGDVYLFDLNGNVLDIYTKDVSHKAAPKVSLIYYDETYFAYSTPNMVLDINR